MTDPITAHLANGGAKLSARRRVELALPAALLRYVCLSCAQVQEGEAPMGAEEAAAHTELLRLLGISATEPFAGLSAHDATKLRRRVDRAVVEVFTPYIKANAVLMKAFLMTLFWLKERLDSGELVLVAGSAFDSAVTMLLPQLEDKPDLWEMVEGSAAKQARKFHQHLMGLGYYVETERSAA